MGRLGGELLPDLSSGCGFSEQTFAGANSNEKEAPGAAIRLTSLTLDSTRKS